jgi:hypothetical protein
LYGTLKVASGSLQLVAKNAGDGVFGTATGGGSTEPLGGSMRSSWKMLILVLAGCGRGASAVPVVGPDGKAAHQFKCIEPVAECDDRGVCNPPADPLRACKQEAAKNCPNGFYFIGLAGPGGVYKRNTVFTVCNGNDLSAEER